MMGTGSVVEFCDTTDAEDDMPLLVCPAIPPDTPTVLVVGLHTTECVIPRPSVEV